MTPRAGPFRGGCMQALIRCSLPAWERTLERAFSKGQGRSHCAPLCVEVWTAGFCLAADCGGKKESGTVWYWWQALAADTVNDIICGCAGAQCLHYVKPRDRRLPEKNVALQIRTEQQIVSNSNSSALFVLMEQYAGSASAIPPVACRWCCWTVRELQPWNSLKFHLDADLNLYQFITVYFKYIPKFFFLKTLKASRLSLLAHVFVFCEGAARPRRPARRLRAGFPPRKRLTCCWKPPTIISTSLQDIPRTMETCTTTSSTRCVLKGGGFFSVLLQKYRDFCLIYDLWGVGKIL